MTNLFIDATKTIGLAKMSTQGQLTMPKAIRDQLELEPSDQVVFMLDDRGEVVVKKIKEAHAMYNAKFQSQKHEEAFKSVLETTRFKSEYSYDDKFYQSMVYLLTSDFLEPIFRRRLAKEEDGLFIIDHKAPIDVLSSTEKFMTSYALGLYFTGVPHEYKFSSWFWELNRSNQELMMESLGFLKH